MVVLTVPGGMPAVNVDLSGGASGDGSSCAAGKGGDGALYNQNGEACPDVDGDSFTAAACGGLDCDDADASIRPGSAGDSVREACDGQDNDCNGAVDDDLPPGACPVGMACMEGLCVPDGSKPDGGAPAGPAPDHLEYAGGCGIGGRGAGKGREGALLAFIFAGAFALARTRFTRSRRSS
jgi:hypothetical protein